MEGKIPETLIVKNQWAKSIQNMEITRGKIKKTQNILKICSSQASMVHLQSTESGAMVGSNDDLLTEILLRLPVTSILRFKSVSKHWRFLLSHRHFTLRFDKLSNSSGLFIDDKYVPFDVKSRNTPPSYKLDFGTSYRYGFKIVQSCNGLLLCCCSNYYDDLKYYVFNPTTNQFAIIPSPHEGNKVRKTISFMGLAFHQKHCAHYKVICIHKKEGGKMFQIQIYSSDTRKWKISLEFFADLPVCMKGVYWNGAIYWAPFYDNHFYFQIEVEQLQLLPLPVEMSSSDTWTMYFGESRGHLHLVVGSEENTNLCLNVYEMLRDHSGWFVKYQVELHELPGAFPEMISSPGYDFEVIDVVRGEKEDDTFIVLIIPGKIITYNVHNKSFKQMSDLPNYASDEFLYCHRYIEFLSSF